jgi:diaminohydroxyphosphoribosylaminopyrimidine deaminase / 5-amino-6-(5-phosphoribosylamino)uracil reductase
MKIAASLDGKTALDNGTSQWITSEAARADGHAWRARAGAVLTGIGTVLEDDPRLDVRHVPTLRQPWAVVVDSRLETPLHANVFIPGRPLVIYCAVDDAARQAALESRGATVVRLPGPGGKVDLAAMLRDLARREVNELHVEAGHKLNGSLMREGLVDEMLVYLAPKLVGQGREMAHFGPLADLAGVVAFEFVESAMIGPDVRLLARAPGRDHF